MEVGCLDSDFWVRILVGKKTLNFCSCSNGYFSSCNNEYFIVQNADMKINTVPSLKLTVRT